MEFPRRPQREQCQFLQRRQRAQNTGRMFVSLKPRGERQPMKQVVEGLRRKLRDIAGINVFMRPIQNLQLGARSSKAQYQYILQSVRADELNDWANKLQERLRADPLFRDVTSDAQLRGLQAQLKIDRERADTLGVTIDSIRSALYSAFGERQVSTIYLPTDSYWVIMEVAPDAKRDESALNGIYVRSSTGALVPLTSFATVERTVGPTSINHVGQLQAVTVRSISRPVRRSAMRPRRSSKRARRYRCRVRSSRATAVTPPCSRAHRASRRS